MMINASMFYTVNFLVSVLLLTILLWVYGRKVSAYYAVTYSCVCLSSMGFMQLATADNLQAALYANQTVYLGSIFAPLAFLLCIADLCKIRVNKILFSNLAGLAGLVFILVSTIGLTDLYYKNVSLSSQFGISVLIKEYGPLHIIYPLYLMLIALIGIYFVIASFVKKNEVPYSTSVGVLVSLLIAGLGYFYKNVFSVNLEITPIAYNIGAIVLLFLLRRISLLNTADMMAKSMEESDQYGFVVYDSNGRLLGSDDTAKKWFPEIAETYVGKPLVFKNPEVMEMFEDSTDCHNDTHNISVKIGSSYIEIKHSHVKKGMNKPVHCLYFRDDTVQQNLNNLLKNYNENLEKEVDTKTRKLRNIQNDIIVSMASIVENRDNNTGGHIRRTSDVVRIFVKNLQKKSVIKGLTEEMAACIIKAAPLHDFGKIAIPDKILNKPGKFEPDEYEIMKLHAPKGAVIVKQILTNSNDQVFTDIAINVAHYHHEKWDGSGYPEKLAGDNIPFEARVMALADVFDALVSKRVYKERMSYEEAFDIIKKSEGTHFEPVLCRAFLECRQELIELYESYDD